MPTTPSGYYFADGSTPMSAEDISAAEATSAQLVFNNLAARNISVVADFTALAALSTANKLAGDLAFVVEGEVYMSWTGTVWRQVTVADFASTGARDTAYAKASAAFRTTGAQCRVASSLAPHSVQQFYPANGNTFWRHLMGDVPLLAPLISGNGTIVNNLGGPVQFTGSSTVGLLNIFSTEFQSYRVEIDYTGPSSMDIMYRFGNAGVANANNVYFWTQQNNNGTTVAGLSSGSSPFIPSGRIAPNGGFVESTIMNPAGTGPTRVLSRSHDGENFHRLNAGSAAAATYTDLFLGAVFGGANSGVIRVYGRAS
jgi:hypothetical protein